MHKNLEEVRKELLMADWENLWPRFLLYTEKRVMRMYWRGQLGGPIPGGIESHDIVMKAIDLVLIGERKWPRGLKIEQFFLGVIKSLISHLTESYENVSSECIEEKAYKKNHQSPATDSKITDYARHNKIVDGFFDFLKDDPIVHNVAGHILHHSVDKPEELSQRLNHSTAEINNAKRRLKRRLIEWSRNHLEAINLSARESER